MKKVKLIAMLLLIIAFAAVNFSCSEESTPTPSQQCELNNTGRIDFINNTSYQISLNLDTSNNYTLTSGETSGKDLSVGLHSYYGSANSGQYTWSGTLDINQCDNQTLNFVI